MSNAARLADAFMRWREALAWVVVAAIFVTMAMGVATPFLTLAADYSSAQVMGLVGGSFLGLVSCVLLLMAVGACTLVKPRTRHAGALATVAAVLVSIAVVIAVVFMVAGAVADSSGLGRVLNIIGGLTDTALKLVVAIVLWLLARRGDDGATPDVEPEPGEPSVPAVTWPKDQAAGARWTSAGEAAEGRAATWSDAGSGQRPRWNPRGDDPDAT